MKRVICNKEKCIIVRKRSSGKIPAKFGLRTNRTVNKMDVLLTGRPSKINLREVLG